MVSVVVVCYWLVTRWWIWRPWNEVETSKTGRYQQTKIHSREWTNFGWTFTNCLWILSENWFWSWTLLSKFFPKILKGTELNRYKNTGTSQMKLPNRCKKHRDKPVQLMKASIIIIRTHASLQLCVVAPNHIAITCNGTDGDHNYLYSDNTEISGAQVWLIIILVMYSTP